MQPSQCIRNTKTVPYLPIEETEVFKLFERASDRLWHLSRDWNGYARNRVGEQLVRAVDSVGATLVEGDGRHAHADPLRFFVIATASAREARYWLERAKSGPLVSAASFAELDEEMDHGIRALNIS